jgi:hypothetical protein
MAIAAYPATIKAGSTAIKDIDSFELPFKNDMEETTSFSQTAPGTKTFIPTLRGMEQKLSGNWNMGDAGQQALEDAFFNRTTVNIVASPDGTKTYTFDAWVSEYSPKADVGGKVTVDFTLTMNGDVTRA